MATHQEANRMVAESSAVKGDPGLKLAYKDGVVVGGSLASLIRHLTPTAVYCPDRAFLFAMLLNSRAYIHPSELLKIVLNSVRNEVDALVALKKQEISANGSTNDEDVNSLNQPENSDGKFAGLRKGELRARELDRRVGQLATHTLALLASWTDLFATDFLDERTFDSFRSGSFLLASRFASAYQPLAQTDGRSASTSADATGSDGRSEVDYGQAFRTQLSCIVAALCARLSDVQRYEDALLRVHNETRVRLQRLDGSTDIVDVCAASTLRCAQQLTHIELDRLRAIGAPEFVDSASEQHSISNSTTSGPNRTDRVAEKTVVNLDSYVGWFNRLSYLVATEVCMQLRKKTRVQVIEFWINVAKECFSIGNFNSLMAIFAGLNLAAVTRLKRSWDRVGLEKYEALQRNIDPRSNYASYRSTLRAAIARASQARDADSRERIVIPFFGLFLKDLYFLKQQDAATANHGQPSSSSTDWSASPNSKAGGMTGASDADASLSSASNAQMNRIINIEKWWEVTRHVSQFLTYKQVVCPFPRHDDVIYYLLTTPIFNEQSLLLASFECEPPSSVYERQLCKDLKQ